MWPPGCLGEHALETDTGVAAPHKCCVCYTTTKKILKFSVSASLLALATDTVTNSRPSCRCVLLHRGVGLCFPNGWRIFNFIWVWHKVCKNDSESSDAPLILFSLILKSHRTIVETRKLIHAHGRLIIQQIEFYPLPTCLFFLVRFSQQLFNLPLPLTLLMSTVQLL